MFSDGVAIAAISKKLISWVAGGDNSDSYAKDGGKKMEHRSLCKYNPDCHFFQIRNATGSVEALKELYCFGEHQTCKIFQRRESAQPVSITLWPNRKLQQT